jgi:hypothetical protein
MPIVSALNQLHHTGFACIPEYSLEKTQNRLSKSAKAILFNRPLFNRSLSA